MKKHKTLKSRVKHKGHYMSWPRYNTTFRRTNESSRGIQSSPFNTPGRPSESRVKMSWPPHEQKHDPKTSLNGHLQNMGLQTRFGMGNMLATGGHSTQKTSPCHSPSEAPLSVDLPDKNSFWNLQDYSLLRTL